MNLFLTAAFLCGPLKPPCYAPEDTWWSEEIQSDKHVPYRIAFRFEEKQTQVHIDLWWMRPEGNVRKTVATDLRTNEELVAALTTLHTDTLLNDKDGKWLS